MAIADTRRQKRLLALRQNRDLIFLALVVAILLVIASAASPAFRTTRNLTNLLNQMVPLGLVALGQTLPILTTGLDMSVGAVMSLVTAVAATQMTNNVGLGLCLGLLAGILVGLANGVAITRLKVQPLIVTLATSSVVAGITLMILPYPGGYVPRSFVDVWTTPIGGVVPSGFIILLVAAAVLWFICSHTRFGRSVYAVGGDEGKAEIAGINVKSVLLRVYILSGLFAALAGLALAARMRSGDPLSGGSFTLEAVAAVVIGGTNFTGGRGNVIGTLLGVVVISVLRITLNLLGISPFYQDIASGVMVIAAVLYASKR